MDPALPKVASRSQSRWAWVVFGSLIVLLVILLLLVFLYMVCSATRTQVPTAACLRQASHDDGKSPTWVERFKATLVGDGGKEDAEDEGELSSSSLWSPPSDGCVQQTNQGSRFLVLRNYNNEGGFFWQIYNLLCAAHVAKLNRMSLVVLFDSGLYLERNARFLNEHRGTVSPTNWFHSYFEGLAETYDERIAALIRERSPLVLQAPALRLVGGKAVDLKRRRAGKLQIYEFARSTFDERPMDVDYGACWRAAARPLPYIERKVAEFMHRHGLDAPNCFLIGIHFRGSDKYGNADDNEDGPVHYEYEWCQRMVCAEMKAAAAQGRRNCKVLVCSDEQPFVEHMRAHLPPSRVVYTSAIRSSVNTGGKHYQTHECTDDTNASPDCVVYRDLKHQSVHRGMPDHSAHQKGEDVLIDVLLLSKCNVFLRSRGNVSNFPGYINAQMRVVDLADAYRA
jgi:hypothetical protein